MEPMIYGTSAPHRRSKLTTQKIMQFMILALLPAGIHGVFLYGVPAAVVVLLTCVSAVVTEFIFEKAAKKTVNIKDCRILLTGLIMSYCLPATVSWYVAVLAGVLCGLTMQLSLHFFRRNIVSPVIFTRLILMFLFKAQMNTYLIDGLTMATPLEALKAGEEVNTLYMIFGKTGGCIGETSALLLCVGAMMVIMKGIMDFRVAGMYLFSFSAFMAVFGGHGLSSYYLTAQLAGGGMMLALWYIAPAYSTLPITKAGRWIYGIVLGVFTGIFRIYGPGAENLCYAILLANLCVPLIEKFTVRRPFGVEKGQL